MPENSIFRILHISDIHIKKRDEFDRSVVLDPLIDRVVKDREAGLAPEIVVVTGDIAFSGKKEEYETARAFFDTLLSALELPNRRLFIIPGNHDVDRKKYRPSDRPIYENMKALNDELEDEDYRADLLKGMNDYFRFIETCYPHMKPVRGRAAPFAKIYRTRGGKRIGLLGLNSAWMCRISPDEREIAIGEFQVRTAMAKLRKQGDIDLQINLFHHPLDWLWPKDRIICQGCFNNTILLCGHLHDAAGGYTNDLDGSLFQFQAGGAYLGSESKWPARFQYISIDWEKERIRLDFRKYNKNKRKWVLDADTGDDGKKSFGLMTPPQKTLPIHPGLPLEKTEIYLEWLIENHGCMDVDRLQGKGRALVVSLPEIFIPLYAHEPGKQRRREPGKVEKHEPVDVEALISQSDCLLIEGHAGSGKTTLLKHLAYCLARQYHAGGRLHGLDGLLPLLIFLKDLAGFFKDPDMDPVKDPTAEDLLAWLLRRKMAGILDLETVERFLEAGKVIILLDGLDETPADVRDAVANAFADLRIRRKGVRLVLTGRPHGIKGAALNRFHESHVAILPLDPEQIQLFIRKWFLHLYPGSSGIGGKSADAMIREIREHPAIDRLIDNPLMLTAICILYHGGKELPGQRAELYKKFIDNLLYRRFPDPELVRDFLKMFAFKMHEKEIRSADRGFALDVLASIHSIRRDETEKEFKTRIREQFDHIEPRCGLLKFENGQHRFWHLTFQEFLTADYIADNHSDHIRAIRNYWGNEWYKEVIELYVGYLSIEHKKTANDIVASALEEREGREFKRWRLAARSMIDIHKNRRGRKALGKAKGRMIEIIDADADSATRVDAGEILGWLGDTRDLKEFVGIEGGEYDLERIGNVKLEAFEIGKYPVTNAWYGEFIEAGGYSDKEYWSPEGRKWLAYTKMKQPRLWSDREWTCPNSPAVGVSWYEVDAFTRWLSMTRDDGYRYRLPREKEWQAAAAGFERRKYPWGGEWDKNRCNSEESKIEKISPVGVFGAGCTPEGVFDLSGNVWEWTRSDYHGGRELNDFSFDEEMQKLLDEENYGDLYVKLEEEDRQLPILRGGSWLFDEKYCRCAARFSYHPYDWFYYIGFRCARTYALNF